MPYANPNTINYNNYNTKRREALMPPEPLPLDRKGEFFRERKHGNGYNNGHHHHYNNIGGGVGPGGGGRWRDSPAPFAGSRNNPDFSPRWSEFRRPPGHGKQGSWHMYHEDCNGFPTPRSDRFVDDDGFRPSGPRGDGRYGRIYREFRNGYGQRDWRSHSWENNHHYIGPSSTPGRPHNLNDLKSVGDSPLRPSHPNLESSDQLQLKDQADKTKDANGTGTSQRVDKENTVGSLDWKPLKWSRSGSLTSRGSGLSHSSCSKSPGGESSDVKGDLPPKCLTPVQSPTGDAAGCAPSDGHIENTSSRKKPRLGWGEGLAKFEKKKVEPEENTNKVENPAAICNVKPLNSLISNMSERTPMITGFSDCLSPATPSSFACSSSPGIEEKTYCKKTDGDAKNLSVASLPVSGNQPEGLQFSLEKLELDSIANLSSLLVELLQVDDQCSMDSGFMRSSAFNKLLLWKGDISKALELTETEIDSLENKLKALKVDCVQGNPCLALSSPFTADGKVGHSDGQDGSTRPVSLEVVSFRNVNAEDTVRRDDTREIPDEIKDADIDSPGTATSKLSESPVRKPVSPCGWEDADPLPADAGFVDSMKNTPMTLHTYVGEDETVGTSCQYDDAMVIHDDNGAVVIEHPGGCSKEADNLCDVILASNEDTAAKASEVFSKFLPSCPSGKSVEATRLSCLPADYTIREKFLRRKRFLRFKERVLILKYRAYHHVWKEDSRLLSLRSHRSKFQKKLDLSPRTMLIGNQKHPSSMRSCFASPGGSLSLVPRMELLNLTSKLLADTEVKPCRSSLKMPAMILDEKERMSSRFVSSNGLVEDPCAVEKERALINPWTIEEKEIFMEKLASYGKDFSKIASFLHHKTTADCVEFYYKNHRSECFEKTKKLDAKKQMKPLSSSTYLLTSGKKWDRREINAASLDILGAASVIASQADQAVKISKLLSEEISNSKSRGADGFTVASSSFYAAEDERETAAADVLAGICGSFSSEPMGSSVTSSVDPGEGNPDWKRRRVGSSVRRPLTPEVTQNVDDDTCSDESCGEMDSVDWTDDEKSLFVLAFSSHGKDFLMISRFVRTKTRDQCKVFFSKARKCLGLDTINSRTGSGRILGSNDTNGGGSDNEDTCVVETGFVVCGDKSGSRMDEDLPQVNQDVSKPDSVVIADLNAAVESCGPGQLDFKDADMEPEVLCPSDNPADVSEIELGVMSVGVQEKFVEADDLQRRRFITLDETLKADSAINIVKGVSARLSCHIDPQSVSCAIDGSSGGTFKDGELYVREAPISSSLVQDAQSQQSSECGLHNQQCGTSIAQGKSCQVCKGLPLDLLMKSEKNDASSRVSPESKVQAFQECYSRKCSRSASQNSIAQVPFRCKEDRNSDNSMSRNSAEANKPCSNGDVKLFGKIFSKTSSVEKPTSSVQAYDDKVKHHSSAGRFNFKPCSNQEANGNFILAKHDHNSFLGLENVPITSGFWDGTKIRTGFPSVSDSARLLAKYPDAFGVSSLNTEQQRLQPALYSNECNTNGACVFSPTEYNNSGGSVKDCPVFRNPEGVQPFTLNVKQKLESYPEVQRNGFEPMSSIQAHGKGVVTLNVVQGEGGGICSGISDPVAALRMHYSQQYGGGGPAVNGLIREETWRGREDVRR